AARAAGDGKVATVGEHAITRAQLEEHVRAKLIELENQRYEMLREGLDELIAEELVKQEASARKTTLADLEKQEVAAKVAEPTDEEIQKVYDANKAQLGSQTLEQIKPRIVEYLKQQGMQRRRQRAGQLLEGSRHPVRQSDRARRGPAEGVREERGPRRGQVRSVPQGQALQGGDRQGRGRRREGGRQWHARLLHQRADALRRAA